LFWGLGFRVFAQIFLDPNLPMKTTRIAILLLVFGSNI